MDNLKKIEAFLDMPSDDDMVYGEALTEDFEENDLPAEIRIPASEYPEYDEYYDDEDGELYTELNIYIEDNYGVTPVDFHWTITPDEIIISDITWSDEEDIEPEVEEPEVDFPEDDVMEDLNEAKLRKNDLTDENLANFEMELQEIKDNLADFGPEGLYAVPYESFKREFPIFTEKVIESFLDEMDDSGEGDWQEGELIWENDWPCLIEGAEKLLNGKGFQWEKLYTKYYKPDNGPVEVNDTDDYDDDYDDDMFEESLHESKLNEKLPSELITAIKKVGFDKDPYLDCLDIEDSEAKIITPEETKDIKKMFAGLEGEHICVVYNGTAYFPFARSMHSAFPKKPDGVSLNKLLQNGTIYYIKDRPRKHWKNRYRTYGDETNSHELTPDEKSASFEKTRWKDFNNRNDELKNRLAQVNKMRDDVFNSVNGMYESLNESSSRKDNIDIIEKELEADFYGLTLEDYYEDEDTLMISIRDAIGEIYDISIKKSELDQPGGLSYILFNELDLAIERGDVTEDRPVDESLNEDKNGSLDSDICNLITTVADSAVNGYNYMISSVNNARRSLTYNKNNHQIKIDCSAAAKNIGSGIDVTSIRVNIYDTNNDDWKSDYTATLFKEYDSVNSAINDVGSIISYVNKLCGTNEENEKHLYICDDCGYEAELTDDEYDGMCPNCHEHHGFYRADESLTEGADPKVLAKVRKDIEKAKNKLKGKKPRENFGQEEVRKLRDKYFEYRYGMNHQVFDLINQFEDWCGNYAG